jgi:hypothetical protein
VVPGSGPGGASGGLVIAVRVEHELMEGLAGGGVVDADVRVSLPRPAQCGGLHFSGGVHLRWFASDIPALVGVMTATPDAVASKNKTEPTAEQQARLRVSPDHTLMADSGSPHGDAGTRCAIFVVRCGCWVVDDCRHGHADSCARVA